MRPSPAGKSPNQMARNLACDWSFHKPARGTVASSAQSSWIPMSDVSNSARATAVNSLNERNPRLDITAHTQQEEDQRHSEQDLRAFLEGAHMPIHWVGPDGLVLWANHAAELQMLGYRPEEYIGHPISDFHADQPVIEDILKRLTDGETITDYEARLRHKDGSLPGNASTAVGSMSR